MLIQRLLDDLQRNRKLFSPCTVRNGFEICSLHSGEHRTLILQKVVNPCYCNVYISSLLHPSSRNGFSALSLFATDSIAIPGYHPSRRIFCIASHLSSLPNRHRPRIVTLIHRSSVTHVDLSAPCLRRAPALIKLFYALVAYLIHRRRCLQVLAPQDNLVLDLVVAIVI